MAEQLLFVQLAFQSKLPVQLVAVALQLEFKRSRLVLKPFQLPDDPGPPRWRERILNTLLEIIVYDIIPLLPHMMKLGRLFFRE
ncbi:hypothetical protein D3C72_2367080 [compost metagenome]